MKKILMILLAITMIFTVGCSEKNDTSQENLVDEPQAVEENKEEGSLTSDEVLTITMGDEVYEISYNDIYAMDRKEDTFSNLSSSGEIKETTVTGASLEEVLASIGIDINAIEGFRAVASDGYAIDVPKEVFEGKEVLLSYTEDGEILGDSKLPARLAMDDVRAMYWVSAIAEIVISIPGDALTEETVDGVKQVVIIDSVSEVVDTLEYTYYEALDMAFTISDMLEAFDASDATEVNFVCTDDFVKSETMEVFKENYIKYSGDKAPMFISPDLPKGMIVKYIFSMEVGDTVFTSVSSAYEMLEVTSSGENSGVAVFDLLDELGVKASSYIFEATDGYSIEKQGSELKSSLISLEEDGSVTAYFDSKKVKNLVKIIPVNSEKTESAEKTEGAVETGASWSINVSGLHDGEFDLSSEKAASKLDLYDVMATMLKNDEEKTYDFTGYRLIDVLDFLKVETYETITFVAGDGYEITMSSDDITDTLLLAIVKNGEPLTDEDNLVQLAGSDVPNSMWVKGLSKIVID